MLSFDKLPWLPYSASPSSGKPNRKSSASSSDGADQKPRAFQKTGIPYKTDANALQTFDVWISAERFGNDYDEPRKSASAAEAQVSSSPHPAVLPRISDLYDYETPHGKPQKRLWVVYIHGGAWRDPGITSASFERTVHSSLHGDTRIFPSTPKDANALKSCLHHTSKIAGFASLNYSLCAYPSHPKDPAFKSPYVGPVYPSRLAQHPDHLNDVMAGIRCLQDLFGFTENYVLCGHSCGAALAFQCVKGSHDLLPHWPIVPNRGQMPGKYPLPTIAEPLAIIGLNGIYNFPSLVDKLPERLCHLLPAYTEFLTEAFGKSEVVDKSLPDYASRQEWQLASPADSPAAWIRRWRNGRLAALASSSDGFLGDKLVPGSQTQAMEVALSLRQSFKTIKPAIDGDHDAVWREGVQFATIVLTVVQELDAMENM